MNTTHLNLARFDFVSVRLAVVCARVGNLTEAASECHLVLPAASRRLRDLERALGAPLFERHPRGLRPTALGRAFTKRGMAILHELDNLRVELADASHGVVRHLQVFASTAAITQFLPALLAEYGDLHPEVQVELEEQVSQQVVAAVREGRADLGVYVSGPDLRGLDARDFRTDELVLILPPGHRLAGKTPASNTPKLPDVVARCIRVAVLIGVAVVIAESWVVRVLGLVDASEWEQLTRSSRTVFHVLRLVVL